MFNYPRITIAGIKGGSGKTTLSLGLIAALRDKGLKVIPYKKGPDYIDAGWMSKASGNPCYNLDPFLISKENVLRSFLSHFAGDIAVIEGNRGLYDGMDVDGSFSTAELSKILKSPVILIIDCTKMTRTSAAVVLGCMNIDRDVSIKGVVINQVSGSRHESIVRASIEKYCNVPVVGAIPRLPSGEFPERHMGLVPHHEHSDIERAISFMGDIAEKYLNLEKIIEIAMASETLSNIRDQYPVIKKEDKEVKIGIIRDTAFQFYYPENIEELEKRGADIIDINALKDENLPDVHALYIGGGFPETNAIRLAENANFRKSVSMAAEKGLPIYAECGGLMFLGESIIVDGIEYPMVGLFPLSFEMRARPQAHGYTIVEVERENPIYPLGTLIRGHEFHYSEVRKAGLTHSSGLFFAFKMKRGQGIINKMDGLCYKNVFAAYTHVHALGAVEWADGLIKKAKEYKLAHN